MTDRRQELLLELIAARLDDLMAQQAISRAQVYLRAHGQISPNTIGNVLRARDYKLSTLLTFADALNCRVEINILPHSDREATYKM